MPIRLGAIAFVNTVPVYFGLRPDPAIQLVYDVPARLNAMMDAGQLDVSPVSSAYYLRNRDKLVLLDDLSVSSPGAVESVIFVSRKPLGPALLDSPVVSVPDDSETSVALLAHLLHQATGEDLRPWFRIYDAANYRQVLEETGSTLVIGDNALLLQKNGLPQGYHCYDLSTLWRDETMLPFVFAVWVANRPWAKANPAALKALNEALIESRARFFSEPDVYAAGLAVAHEKCGVPQDKLAHYYSVSLDYRLTEPHLVSLSRFDQVIRRLEGRELSCQQESPL